MNLNPWHPSTATTFSTLYRGFNPRLREFLHRTVATKVQTRFLECYVEDQVNLTCIRHLGIVFIIEI